MKVSPACAGCYALDWDARWGGSHWGKDAPRRFFGDKHWAQPLKWNRDAQAAGVRERVFAHSMSDVFEDRPDLVPHRIRLFHLINATPWLDWLILTKRPENVRRFAESSPGSWSLVTPPNAWYGTTVEDRKHGLPRLEALRQLPAAVRFVSAEPLLEDLGQLDLSGIGWVIVGGESGRKARPMHPDWARGLRDRCVRAGVAFHFKQHGEWAHLTTAGIRPDQLEPARPITQKLAGDTTVHRIGTKAAGRYLDGRTWDEVPTPAGVAVA